MCSLPIIVDSHCHLDYIARNGKDLNTVITNAHSNGVRYMQSISILMSTFPSVLNIANTYDGVFCSVGVHPCHVHEEPVVSLDTLIDASKHKKVIGIGESGLDYFYTKDHATVQEQSFRVHIAAARQTGLPLIVHTRGADSQTVHILQDEYKKGEFSALIHCFSVGEEVAKAALDMGFYISVSGILTFPKGQNVREIVKNHVPLHKILVETDSPYLSPVPQRGKQCEPAFTMHTAECLAQVMGVSYAHIAKHTTNNFFTLFQKAVK